MSETEIMLARAYLAASGQDAVAALIRSVKDIARLRRAVGPVLIEAEADRSGPAHRLRSPAEQRVVLVSA